MENMQEEEPQLLGDAITTGKREYSCEMITTDS
jgi:hypothetical protein